MDVLNTVDEVTADLYAGDEEPIWLTPTPAANDPLAVADWIVVARYYKARFTTVAPPAGVMAVATVVLTRDPVSGIFKGSLSSDLSATFTAGLWTTDIWRTNAGAHKLLLRVKRNVTASIVG